MNLKIFTYRFFFIISIIFSFIAINWFLLDDILIDHDLAYAFGRNFFFPEHGRYIATFFNHVLTEVIPEYLNIHPNDFQPIIINPLKAIFTIIIFIFFSFANFIFADKTSKQVNYSFILIYLLIFLSIFNSNFNMWLGNELTAYFSLFENTVFWEYPMSLFIYIPFWTILIYLYTKNKQPNSTIIIITSILGFLVAISVEPLNDATFISIILLNLILFLNKKNNSNESLKKCFALILSSFTLGMFLYYININSLADDHQISTIHLTYSEYLTKMFPCFIKKYFTFYFKENIIYLLIPAILMFFLKKSNSYNNEEKNNIIVIISINILGFLIFFFSTFIMGFCYNYNVYWFEYLKWSNLFSYAELFNVLILLGFLIDSNIKIKKYSNIIKINLCILILLIFGKTLIIDNFENCIKFRAFLCNLKTQYYNIEKLAITQTTSELYLPNSYKNHLHDTGRLWWLLAYINSVHPDICKTKIVFTNKIDEEKIIQDNEKIKFNSLLRYKRFRIKKEFKNFRTYFFNKQE